MKRIQSKAALLKKRVRAVQSRAKFAGLLYLLGTVALAAVAALVVFVRGAYISPEEGTLMMFKSVIDEALFLVKGNGSAGGFNAVLKDAELLMRALVLLIYVVMLLVVVINVFRCLGKLGWLFKRRASYSNGFNRNAYAMDDMSKRYSSSLAAIIVCNLLIFALGGIDFTQLGYFAIIGGVVWHLLAGLIEGKVTLFTTGEKMEEEEREHGLFVFFLRNIFQLAVLAGVFLFFVYNPFEASKSTSATATNTVLGKLLLEVLDLAVVQRSFGSLMDMKLLIPLAVELLAWISLIVLVKHATAATEFNRDGLDGAGMKNFAVFAFIGAVCLAGLALLPTFGFGEWFNVAESGMNNNLIIAAAIAFVGFLLDCFVRPRLRGSYDEVDTDAYFSDSYEQPKYNNTIV